MSVFNMIQSQYTPIPAKDIFKEILVPQMVQYKDIFKKAKGKELAPIIRKELSVGVTRMLEEFTAPPPANSRHWPRWERLHFIKRKMDSIHSDEEFWAWYNQLA